MKKMIIPVGLSVLLVVVFNQINPGTNAVGILLAVLMGAGIGAAVNSLIFKEKKQEQEQKQE